MLTCKAYAFDMFFVEHFGLPVQALAPSGTGLAPHALLRAGAEEKSAGEAGDTMSYHNYESRHDLAWQDDIKAALLAAQKCKRERAEAPKQARQAAKEAAELARKEEHRKRPLECVHQQALSQRMFIFNF